MRVTFIGSGNTATVMARLCKQKGHEIQQIIARNEENGKPLASEMGCNYVSFNDKLHADTDVIIVALADNCLPEALNGFHFNTTPVVHTAGACNINVVENISQNYGVLYPLQSLRKEMNTIPPIPFLIEANNEETLKFIHDFAHTLSDVVVAQNADERIRLHAAAVVVNNFTNYLFGVAEKFCSDEKVDFNLLKPIIKETADRIQNHSPLAVQTGPALRSDITTLDKHLRLLNDHPKLRTLYMRMTDGIMNG
ncbi:MAG: DUF2520 domain-containing protein [Ferruginibacter sp.]|nr:DUF2520 domain-containing protein [Ferruginibacter sp.]